MTESLRLLLFDLIEYAGMFPPAKLPFEQAFENYLRYRKQPENWILSRFICPTSNLENLSDSIQSDLVDEWPIRVSVLIASSDNPLQDPQQIIQEVQKVNHYSEINYPKMMIESIETKISEGLIDTILKDEKHDLLSFDLTPFSASILNAVMEQKRPLQRIFVELPYNGTSISITAVKQMLLEFEKLNHYLSKYDLLTRVGIKIRCGGTNIIPSIPLSEVMIECAKRNVPFKATAGLHYPFFDKVRNEKYGFISLFIASAFAYSNPNIDIEFIQTILTEKESQNFFFHENGMTYLNQWHLTNEQISHSRKLFQSFGSCSFEEPLDELKKIGWLNETE